ncbi:MAG TPA: phosphate ABC transporter permease subunit PstC [Candidatus Nitrosotenuis sp.]|jgi:phosphate transport system permease protein|nr:phosphate ABC transporter permease subunit PstC [Candidatus Nitrosotenuis sp.]
MNKKILKDQLFRYFLIVGSCLILAIFISMFWVLYQGAAPVLKIFGLKFLYTADWDPVHNKFGALTPLFGTIITSLIAISIAAPLGFAMAFFIREIAPKSLQNLLRISFELLAGIPSIIYGMWGLLQFAPFFAKHISPILTNTLGQNAIIGFLFQASPSGIGILSAAIILSIMILPFITAVLCDAFTLVPSLLKESAYGLGATRWEVAWYIILPYSKVAFIGGIILALGRALGETMAVSFIIGNSHRFSSSLLMPGSTISSVLANEFTEATTLLHSSSIIALGFILFILTFCIIALSQILLTRLRGGYLHD